MHTPVLLLFFNRPAPAAAVFSRVRAARPPRLYVHVDGPRVDKQGEDGLVAKCRDLVEKVDWPCEVFTLFREENMGLRAGVSGAINWFFDSEAQGIVLEDDCHPDLSFFQYCETLLDYYKADDQIMHISGSNVAANKMRHLQESYFGSRFSLVWGWASWRRAWKKMSLDLDGLDDFIAAGNIHKLIDKPAAQAYMLDKFRKTRDGEHNSWAYAWFYSILKHEGYCIVPTKNLVENSGVGLPEATNTKTRFKHLQLKACSVDFPLQHPKVLTPRKTLEMELFYYTQKRKLRLLLWYWLHRIGLR